MADLFLPPADPRAAQHLRATADLLAVQPWFQVACTTWPAPIAHELARLHEMLQSGQDTGGCLFQVRDLAEILIKTVTLSYAADLLANCATVAPKVRVALLKGQMSLGSWVGMLRELRNATPEAATLLVPELRVVASKGTAFSIAVESYVPRRNEDIGHGAYRRDSYEIAKRIRLHLLGDEDIPALPPKGLSPSFAALFESGIWNECEMRIGNPDGVRFSGANSIKETRHESAHETVIEPVFMVRGDASIELSPLIARRTCKECSFADAFVYEGPHDRNPKRNGKLQFTDYANGHRLESPAADDPMLASIINAFEGTQIEATAAGEFRSKEVVALLDDIMFDNRYMSPTWIREALASHMRSNSRGIFWLEAPAHIGKTMFLRGLVGDGLAPETAVAERQLPELDANVFVLPVFIKREYRFRPQQFINNIQNVALSQFRFDTSHDLVIADAETAAGRRQNFATFLQKLRKAVGEIEPYGYDRLILAIDGLDELPMPDILSAGETARALSPVDFLPTPNMLPDNTTIVLTSRRLDDPTCPAWLASRLGNVLPHNGTDCLRLRADVDTQGYVDLLRSYVGRHSGFAADHPRFDDVWHAVRGRSEGLFLFVSFLCDLIREEMA